MSSTKLSSYWEALATPGAATPVLSSALARLPIAMISLATLLYVQRMTGSFGAAGLVSAGLLAGSSLGVVAQGRLMDGVGPTRPLLVASVAFAVAAAGLIVALETGQPLAVLVVVALLTGLVQPGTPAASRALWGRLVPAGPLRDAAYSYEAISLEMFFILGPALAAFLASTPWPGTGLVVAVAAMAVGTAAFASSRVVRTQEVVPRPPSLGLLGALARPGMRTVALAAMGCSLVVGAVEVGVPAVATAAGSPVLAGVLLSAWSVTSVLAGVLYSMRPWPRPLHLRVPVLLAAFALLVAALALTELLNSLVALVVVMLAAGALITPQLTANSLAVQFVVPTGAATEGFGWVVTASMLGLAVGQSLGGGGVHLVGPSGAFIAGGIAGVLVAGVIWLRRATLKGPSPVETTRPGPRSGCMIDSA
jgi:MFS family permease